MAVVYHGPLHDAEPLLFQQLCEHCRAQLGWMMNGYSSETPMLNRNYAKQSGGVNQLDFLGLLHEESKSSYPQTKVATADKVQKDRLSRK